MTVLVRVLVGLLLEAAIGGVRVHVGDVGQDGGEQHQRHKGDERRRVEEEQVDGTVQAHDPLGRDDNVFPQQDAAH